MALLDIHGGHTSSITTIRGLATAWPPGADAEPGNRASVTYCWLGAGEVGESGHEPCIR